MLISSYVLCQQRNLDRAAELHRMVIELAKRGLIYRRPGEPRSIKLRLEPEQIPMLR